MFPTLLLFIITTFTVFTSTLPLLILATLFLYNGIEVSHLNEIIFTIKILLFFTSLLFCIYTILDTILGISLSKKTKSMQNYKSSMRYSKPCQKPFDEIKTIFKIQETQLLITPETEYKCYTLSSIGTSYICISIGMLDSLTMRSTTSEFQLFLKIILARNALILSQNNHFENAFLQMNQCISNFTKWLNLKIFQTIAFILKIIPVVGSNISYFILLFNKLIEKFLTITNSSLIFTYKIISRVLFSKNDQYYDSKLAQIFGGEVVAKAMSLTENPDYKIFSTSSNIHKRIEKVSKIKQIPNITINTFFTKLTTILTIILIFGSFAFFSYEIRIWRIYSFANHFHSKIHQQIEDKINNL